MSKSKNNNSDNSEPVKILWHRIIGGMLEKLLTPTGLSVLIDFPIMTNPPKVDILLIRKDTPTWSQEQLKYLPDGIRQSNASNILIEYKKTESVNKEVLSKTQAYYTLYKRTQNLKSEDIQTFLISSKSVNKNFFLKFEYIQSKYQGVYVSKNAFTQDIAIIELNNLSSTLYNDCFKCFASRISEREKAVKQIADNLKEFNKTFQSFFYSIIDLLKAKDKINYGGNEMIVIDEKNIEEYVAARLLSKLPVKKRLEGLSVDERLEGLSVDERLEGLSTMEILKKISTQDLLKVISTQEVLKAMTPEKLKELRDYFKNNV